MMNTHEKLTYQQLEAFTYNYFEAVANKDITKVLSFYANDATFTVHAAVHNGDPAAWGSMITFQSKQEIHKLYEQFFQDINKTIICRAEHIVIDEQQQRISTEQRFVAYSYAGELISLYNCNFFDFNAQGQLTRVMNWSANEPCPEENRLKKDL
jgi:ketosteroid isomerase-like protein